MFNASNFIIDLETLGLRYDAVCLSFACVFFDFESDKKDYSYYMNSGLYCKLSPVEQISNGRKVEKECINNFWNLQSDDVRKVLKPHKTDMCVRDAITSLNNYINAKRDSTKDIIIWTRGIDIDTNILLDLYKFENIKPVFDKRNARDVRTFIDIFTGNSTGYYNIKNDLFKFPKELHKHNALNDCVHDILRMKELYTIVTTDS